MSLACAQALSAFRPGTCWPGQRVPSGPRLLPEALASGAAELWPLGAAVGAVVGTVCLHRFLESLQPAPELPEPRTLGRSGLLSLGLFTCPPVFLSEAETQLHSRRPLAAGTFFASSTYQGSRKCQAPSQTLGTKTCPRSDRRRGLVRAKERRADD